MESDVADMLENSDDEVVVMRNPPREQNNENSAANLTVKMATLRIESMMEYKMRNLKCHDRGFYLNMEG